MSCKGLRAWANMVVRHNHCRLEVSHLLLAVRKLAATSKLECGDCCWVGLHLSCPTVLSDSYTPYWWIRRRPRSNFSRWLDVFQRGSFTIMGAGVKQMFPLGFGMRSCDSWLWCWVCKHCCRPTNLCCVLLIRIYLGSQFVGAQRRASPNQVDCWMGALWFVGDQGADIVGQDSSSLSACIDDYFQLDYWLEGALLQSSFTQLEPGWEGVI